MSCLVYWINYNGVCKGCPRYTKSPTKMFDSDFLLVNPQSMMNYWLNRIMKSTKYALDGDLSGNADLIYFVIWSRTVLIAKSDSIIFNTLRKLIFFNITWLADQIDPISVKIGRSHMPTWYFLSERFLLPGKPQIMIVSIDHYINLFL